MRATIAGLNSVMLTMPGTDQGRRKPRVSAPFPFGGAVRPFFQPIVDLRHGRVCGFEALARLFVGDRVIPPVEFLHAIPESGRLDFFALVLDAALAAMNGLSDAADCYASVNVDRSLFLDARFAGTVDATLRARSYPPGRLVLEILEDERIADEGRMIQGLERVRSLGVRIALDDVGTAHASLMNIKTLPLDILKLDQTFARGLRDRPKDLLFVLSLLSLARGLGKSLVIEGVETVEILDALTILGVTFVQGYGIARPMPAERLEDWLRTYQVPVATRTPQSLLGAYASHLTVVETCRILVCQPLPIAWKEESKNPHACGIGRYFDRFGLHETAFGLAHKRFHEVMNCYGTDPSRWEQGAEGFASALTQAMRAADA